ncbi:MAG: aldo/keto reductase [Ekhidna sp.]|uniref:aldo/keto reductase n=1 Tax=Ekhidna sp. TaxID=2608089 RepID=UPI0032EAB310
MEYNLLGKTGISVSSLCLGTMTFGDGADEKVSAEMYALARDNGINIFDCADVYANGESEVLLGKFVSNHRHEVILTTKAYYPTSENINFKGGSRFYLTKALDKSLKRLKTEYIDIYYLHSFDENTDLEESLSTLNDFVRQGKVLYLGLSNFSSWQAMKAIGICERKNFAPISCLQPMYNLLKRQCESEILPMAQNEKLGVFSYGPLAGGLLTGKYLNKNRNESGRFDTNEMYVSRYADSEVQESLKLFINFAKHHNFNPASLAIAWAKSHPAISATIIGSRNSKQLNSILNSLNIEMTDELRLTISEFTQRPALATDRSEEIKKA